MRRGNTQIRWDIPRSDIYVIVSYPMSSNIMHMTGEAQRQNLLNLPIKLV